MNNCSDQEYFFNDQEYLFLTFTLLATSATKGFEMISCTKSL